MKLFPKQKEVLKCINETQYKLYVLIGAVRSSKTVTSICALPYMMDRCPQGDICVMGVSRLTLERNIISRMEEIFGCHKVKYNRGTGKMFFCGRTFWCIGADDIKAESKVKGATFAGALVDELTEIPESVFHILEQRLSLKGSFMVATTNTDHPRHWFKQNYVDRAEEVNTKIFEMRLKDNPSLDQVYLDTLKSTHQGVYYQRFIEGLWAKSEGLIFPGFDERCVIDMVKSNQPEYAVAVDWGCTNPCVFLKVGRDDYCTPKVWVEEEYYFDSKKKGYHKTEAEQAETCMEFCLRANARKIFVDPSAVSFITALNQESRGTGIRIIAAVNDVIPGIHKISNLLGTGDLKVFNNCSNLIDEMHSYAWSEQKTALGYDIPKKENDHAVDALRYYLNSWNYKRIDHKMRSHSEGRNNTIYRERVGNNFMELSEDKEMFSGWMKIN